MLGCFGHFDLDSDTLVAWRHDRLSDQGPVELSNIS